ncbi:MAG: Lpp/OprI family alanine-zipper lipoprotein [Spiribacter sp.]|jgi:hypothetical protein|nr:Lpp/OprI family alanine-zipper lipoprotein [Spiribacter sp.]MDR9489266.1 Lpp/OprI family alanine-zipper lipoprotein [Spiribacter sp.]
MSQSLKTLLKLTVAGAAVGLLVGCATQAQLDEATAMAEAAMDEASSAMIKAEGAETLANSAQNTANENSEKIDRMFERSMYK